MTEKELLKAERREKRFGIFLTLAMIFHGLAIVIFFITWQFGNIHGGFEAAAVFFGIGALFSGIAGLHANNFWWVAERVIVSKKVREQLLEMCRELE